jgi:O-antigen ligase
VGRVATWIGAGLASFWTLYFLVTSTVPTTDIPSWHDEQRALQIFLLGLTALIAVLAAHFFDLRASAGSKVAVAAFIVLALSSTFVADLQSHALGEFALFVGLAGLTFAVAAAVSARPGQTGRLICLACLALGVAHVVGVFTRYGAAISMCGSLGLDVLMLGFANPRFPSAFYAVLMPFIAALIVDRSFHRGLRFVAGCSLASLWMINFGLGTRAIFFAYAIAGLLYAFAVGFSRARAQLVVHAGALLLGVALYGLVFIAVPNWLGIATTGVLRDSESLAGSSGRTELWWLAVSVAAAHPLFGIGPMHFATLSHPYGAHPHSWPLQIASEYGLPAALLLAFLLWRLFRRAVRSIRFGECVPAELCSTALFACFVAVVYGLVDGNYLMPLSQSALAIALGVLIGAAGICTERKETGGGISRTAIPAIGSIATIIFALYLVGYAWTSYAQQRSYERAYHLPRFWEQGILLPR